MHADLLAQYLVIALVVMISVVIVARSQFPAATRKLRIAIALPLLRDGMPGWSRALGRRIAPVPRGKAAGCGGCDNCE
jgi:hypothetical protein